MEMDMDTDVNKSPHAIVPLAERQKYSYLIRPTFQYFASGHHKYSSIQKPHFNDTLLGNFIANKSVKDPHEIEITKNSPLLAKANNSNANHKKTQ